MINISHFSHQTSVQHQRSTVMEKLVGDGSIKYITLLEVKKLGISPITIIDIRSWKKLQSCYSLVTVHTLVLIIVIFMPHCHHDLSVEELNIFIYMKIFENKGLKWSGFRVEWFTDPEPRCCWINKAFQPTITLFQTFIFNYFHTTMGLVDKLYPKWKRGAIPQSRFICFSLYIHFLKLNMEVIFYSF